MRLIASENYASRAVMEATGSCLTNKYSEGYAQQALLRGPAGHRPGRGARDRALAKLFAKTATCPAPRSTSTCSRTRAARRTSPCTSRSASRATSIMGLGLPAGGHLTHGHTVSITGKYFKSVPVRRAPRGPPHRHGRGAQAREGAQAEAHLGGTTAYPRTLDFAAFRSIADEVGAILAADIAHIAGPRRGRRAPVADRHRRRRDVDDAQDVPRPARRHDLLQEGARRGDRQAVFPGLQGGPHNHTTAAHRRRRAARRSQPSFKRLRAERRREREGAREALVERGFARHHRRHRQPPHARRPDEQERRRASPPRRRSIAPGIVAQLQLGPVRSAKALRSVGPPHRHAGGHVARDGHGARWQKLADVDRSRRRRRRPTRRCSRRSPAR